jgi:hypothetical protein
VNQLAVITCFYNFYNCKLQEQNLHRFIKHINSFNIPVYGVELILPGQAAATINYKNWKQITVTESNIMWQKEVLLNLAEKEVPEEYTVIAWLDADIQIENKKWVDDFYFQLEFCDFVQLFDEAYWLDADNEIERSATTVVNHDPDTWSGHPGFAWGCKRSTWREIGGLYERCFSGGGDRVTAAVFTNKERVLYHKLNQYIGSNNVPFFTWYGKLKNCVAGNIKGNVYHEFHGSSAGRQYKTRKKYTPIINGYTDILKSENGILTWRPGMSSVVIDHFKDYFINRQDTTQQ